MRAKALIIILCTATLAFACQASSVGAAQEEPTAAEFNQTAEPAAGPAKYTGNVDSMKFHRSSCEFARVMAKSRRIKFQSFKQAKDAGMSPCNWCLPAYWKRVEGKVLAPCQAKH